MRCVPPDNDYQQIVGASCRISPEVNFSRSWDSFGNIVIDGHIDSPHDYFEYESQGEAYLYEPYALHEPLNRIYYYPSPYTRPDEGLRRLLNSVSLNEYGSVTGRVTKLAAAVYRSLEYSPNTTNVSTTAMQALMLRKGVCQDYAHVLIALCRSVGIAARYVAGFLEGETLTHAWVEYYDGDAWRAVDPTHNRIVKTGYIKLSHGRDFDDCSIERGLFTGIVSQRLEVSLSVF